MADIFISYKREEAEQARRLSGVLEQFGFSVWWDSALLSGEEFRGVIREMIDNSTIVIVLWSPLAVKSIFVIDEATHAQRSDKLLPVFLEECELPFGFGNQHADNLSNWDGQISHDGFSRLLQSVEKTTGKKARLGSNEGMTSAQRAEITDFQTAAKLNSTPVWQKFLGDYPATVFRGFVQAHMGDEPATKTLPPPTSEPAHIAAPAQTSHEKSSPAPKRRGIFLLAASAVISLVAAFAILKGFTAPKTDNPPQIESVEAEAVPANTAPIETEIPRQKEPRRTTELSTAPRDDRAEWRLANARDNAAAYQAYFKKFPNSAFTEKRAEMSALPDIDKLAADGKRALRAKQYKKSALLLREAADYGHMEAQYRVGILYYRGGFGLDQSGVRAAKWFRKSADQGYANAQYWTGYLYQTGEGTVQDHKRATIWYKKAAAQGHEKAAKALEKYRQ